MATPPQQFIAGKTVRVSITITDPDTGEGIDPASVTVAVTRDGATITPAPNVINDPGTGAYHADIDTSPGPGLWRVRVDVTGPADAAETYFVVRSDFPAPY